MCVCGVCVCTRACTGNFQLDGSNKEKLFYQNFERDDLINRLIQKRPVGVQGGGSEDEEQV